MSNLSLPPLDELKKKLDYDPKSGEFTWAVSSGPRRKGSTAGSRDNDGYTVICFDYQHYFAHRLAWLYEHGTDPGVFSIDHKDGCKTNNRIDNLRLATHPQNHWNRTSAKGITFSKRDKKWLARVMVAGVEKHLGSFDCPLIARLAYEDKKRELCGEFSPV